MPVHSYITTLVGCLVLRDTLYKQVGSRVCNINKLNAEIPITDLSHCELEANIADYTAFKICPFCANSIWQSQEKLIEAVQFYSTEPNTLTAFCVSENPDLFNSQWVVGYVLNHRRQDSVPEPITDTPDQWRAQVSQALVPHGLWRDIAYGFYPVATSIDTSDV